MAVCDEEILGRTFVDRKRRLKLEVNERFYKGELMEVGRCLSLVRQASIVNLVGPRIVREALNAGLIQSKAIIRIEGIPHAQIVKM